MGRISHKTTSSTCLANDSNTDLTELGFSKQDISALYLSKEPPVQSLIETAVELDESKRNLALVIMKAMLALPY